MVYFFVCHNIWDYLSKVSRVLTLENYWTILPSFTCLIVLCKATLPCRLGSDLQRNRRLKPWGRRGDRDFAHRDQYTSEYSTGIDERQRERERLCKGLHHNCLTDRVHYITYLLFCYYPTIHLIKVIAACIYCDRSSSYLVLPILYI